MWEKIAEYLSTPQLPVNPGFRVEQTLMKVIEQGLDLKKQEDLFIRLYTPSRIDATLEQNRREFDIRRAGLVALSLTRHTV